MRPGDIAFLCAALTWIGFDAWVFVSSARPRDAAVAERRSKYLMVAGILIGNLAAVPFAATRAAWLEPFHAGRWLGVALVALAAALRMAIILGVGRSFTVDVAVPDVLRTTGPYRWLRHPAYAAELVAFTGVALAWWAWLPSLLALVLPTAGLLYRVHVEEQVLAAALGERWTAYARERWRLVPFLY